MESVLLDAAGHRRSPATMPGYHQGRAPRNKGLRYPADPPTIRGDRRGHARGRRGSRRRSAAGADRDPVAGRLYESARHSIWPRPISTDHAVRSSFVGARAAGAEKSGWIVGRGVSCSDGSRSAPDCRSAAAVRDPRRRRRPSLGVVGRSQAGAAHRRSSLESDVGSLPISCAARTRSRWRMKVSRWSLFTASSGTPTSASVYL
jgi:hypothetical protein